MEKQPPVGRSTYNTHKRQLGWQILVPFLVMTGLIIAGALMVIAGGAPQIVVWADVSVIWLTAPVLFFSLAFLVFVIITVYGMAKLLQTLPHYTGKTQTIFARISFGTRKVADGAAKPFVWYKQAGAVIKSIFRLPRK